MQCVKKITERYNSAIKQRNKITFRIVLYFTYHLLAVHTQHSPYDKHRIKFSPVF